MYGSECGEEFPNLVYVVFRSKLCSVHFFTAASRVLGPPSIFIVKSVKPDAKVNINWTRLLDNHKYGAIEVENSSEIYGLSYFSIIDFRDQSSNTDLWTASKSNKTFQEYYLTQLEYSLNRVDYKPDEKTGLLEIVYRSDPRRRHRLVYDGGHIEIKVSFSVKDILDRGLRAGFAFESEISFHKLTILHPDSKLGVGVVLFSNLSLSPTGDFLETTRLVPSLSPSSTTVSKRVHYVHLEEESMQSVFQEGGFVASSKTLVQPSLNRTPVLFCPSPLAHLKPGKEDGTPILVLAGPRLSLQKLSQRRRLRHSLAKALYGVAFEPSYQRTRNGSLKHNPIGIRLQRFAFSAPGQQTADHAAWSMTLTMEVEEKANVMVVAQPNESTQGIYYWDEAFSITCTRPGVTTPLPLGFHSVCILMVLRKSTLPSMTSTPPSLNPRLSNTSFDELELRRMALQSLSKHPVEKPTANHLGNADSKPGAGGSDAATNVGQDVEQELRKMALLSFKKRRDEVMHISNSLPTLTALTNGASMPLSSRPSRRSSPIRSRFVISLSKRSASSSSTSEDDEAERLPSVTLISRRGKIASSVSSRSSSPPPLQPPSPPPTSSLPPPQQINKNFHLDTTLVRQAQTPNKPASGSFKGKMPPSTPEVRLRKKGKLALITPLQSYRRLVLRQSLRVEQLQALVKRQDKVLSFRKRSVAVLGSTLSSLKTKLNQTTKLYLSARQAAVKASKEKQLMMGNLIKAQRELQGMNAVVRRLSKGVSFDGPSSRIRSKSAYLPPSSASEPIPPGPSELISHLASLLDRLKAAFRITSPLFRYFNLFALSMSMPEEVEMMPPTPDTRASSPPPSSLDPNTPICPFYLNGNCVDKTCSFQHPANFTATPVVLKTSLQSCVVSTSISGDIGSICHVCGAQLNATNSGAPDFCSSVVDWHVVFATSNDWTPYLNPPLDLANMHDVAFLKHNLHAVLVSTSTPVVNALNFLQKTNFHPHLFSYAINSAQISSLSARRQLMRQSLSLLLLLAHEQASSFTASIQCMNALLCVSYHACRLEWEACGSKVGISLIEDLLLHDGAIAPACLPPNHLARWGLWYLKVALLLSTTFPQSIDYCPLFEPEKLAALRGIFQVAVLDLGLCGECLSALLSRCSEEGISVDKIFPVLAFTHFYVQFLAAIGDNERAALFCLDVLVSSSHLLPHDNLFFPTAIYLSNVRLQRSEPAVFDLVSDLTNQCSIQTTFAYCFACLMQESGKSEPCSSLLSELVTGLIPLPSLDATSIYSAFRRLLGLAEESDLRMYDNKNITYLWMCFGLFSMLHNFSSSLLSDFFRHVITRLPDYQEEAFPCPLTALLLHLGLALANMLPTAEEYSAALSVLFFPSALTKDMNFRSNPPSWFLEVLQSVRVDKFSTSYPPTPLFTRLLDTYGFRTLKALFAGGGFLCNTNTSSDSLRWLQSLCSIARLEQPIDEEFWLMIAALGIKFYPPEQDVGRGLASYLVECLADAVKLMPLSSRLWRLYALVLRNCGFSEGHRMALVKRVAAVAVGMEVVVEEVFATAGVSIPSDVVTVKSLACKDLTDWWNQSLYPHVKE
ncbi:hypothetical protein TcWFU_008474 [Taenia crassiceps]|uniref:C3H1-type domain-containing protein n=1 Tax=Taenia crassiceps TaxID=6207 RepID=A0ABR4QHY5_9CEST